MDIGDWMTWLIRSMNVKIHQIVACLKIRIVKTDVSKATLVFIVQNVIIVLKYGMNRMENSMRTNAWLVIILKKGLMLLSWL